MCSLCRLAIELSRASAELEPLLPRQEEDARLYEAAAQSRIQREKLGSQREVAPCLKNSRRLPAHLSRSSGCPSRDARPLPAAAQVAARDAAQATEEAAAAERAERAERQLIAARDAHVKAARRANESHRRIREKVEELREEQAQRTARRAEAVLQLKASTAEAAAAARGASERRAEALARREEKRAAEKVEILEKGGNPYRVFRERDEAARAAADRAKVEARLAANCEEMHARLGKQRAAEAQQQRRVEREREAAERAALEMTSVGSQVKSESYMRRVTKTGATLLDPTSRWPRIEPSQHVTMKDWKFGLGLGKDGDILDMMADKYPNTAASSRAEAAARAAALPEPVAARSILADPVASLTLSPLKSASARALAEEARERGEPADEVVEPELPGLWDDGVPAPPGPPSPLKGATLSVLEKRYMAAARQRQRDNVVVEQTVCGKTWRGPAFVPSEPVLEFLDFEAGETYVKTFALTNVSNSFNSFRPAAFPPEVASFFLLEHQPPGRMVAGRSVSLKLTFTPKLGEDIDTVLLLLTHTGPMSVPIRCAPKKLAVLLQTSALHFGTVVLGESASLTLEVKNSGALGTAFAVSLQRGAGDAADEAGKAVFEAGSGGTITLAPRSKATVSLRFTPAAAGSASALLRLDFGGDWRAEHVELSGSGAQVPIYLPRPMIDLRTCLVGALYRDELRVCNRSAVAQQAKTPL